MIVRRRDRTAHVTVMSTRAIGEYGFDSGAEPGACRGETVGADMACSATAPSASQALADTIASSDRRDRWPRNLRQERTWSPTLAAGSGQGCCVGEPDDRPVARTRAIKEQPGEPRTRACLMRQS